MKAISSVIDLLARKGRSVHSIGPEATLSQCAKHMNENGVSSLVVLDPSGKLAGLLTARDLLRVAAEGGARLDSTTAGDVMAKAVHWTSEDASIDEVEQLMIRNRIRHLPVLEGARVVGMISRIDVLRHFLDKQHALSSELEGYISGTYPR